MEKYQVTVKGTWQNLYEIEAESEEEALEQARDLAAEEVMKAYTCPFDLTFENFNSYIS